MTETAIMRDVLVAVTSLPGGMFWRANSGVAVTASRNVTRFNVPGTPDIIGAYNGRAVGIEVKTPTGRLSQAQRNFRAAWERAGGVYIVATSADAAAAAVQALDHA